MLLFISNAESPTALSKAKGPPVRPPNVKLECFHTVGSFVWNCTTDNYQTWVHSRKLIWACCFLCWAMSLVTSGQCLPFWLNSSSSGWCPNRKKPWLIYIVWFVLISAVSRPICPAPEWTNSLNVKWLTTLIQNEIESMHSSIPSKTFLIKP